MTLKHRCINVLFLNFGPYKLTFDIKTFCLGNAIDVVHDLNKLSWQFEVEQFAEIMANHVLETLNEKKVVGCFWNPASNVISDVQVVMKKVEG